MIKFILGFLLSFSAFANCVEDSPYSFSTAGISKTLGRWLFSGEGIVWNLPRDERKIYLTFDDTPSLKYTPSILKQLKEHDVKASFFVIGNRIKSTEERDLLKTIAEQGHDIYPHSENHIRSLLWEEPADLLKELQKLEEDIQKITDKSFPKLYRPPWGIIPNDHRELLVSKGYKIILADVFGGFFSFSKRKFDEPKSKMLPYLLNATQSGSIIVLHNGENRSDAVSDSDCLSEILREYLPKIKQKFSIELLREGLPSL